MATLRPTVAATSPRRTDVHRLAGDMVASAREVAGRVNGSEVDDADSTLGASIVTAGEGGGIEKWEDVSFPDESG